MLSGNEIRKLYLDYFKDKHQHTVVESSSLVPDNPTVLLLQLQVCCSSYLYF